MARLLVIGVLFAVTAVSAVMSPSRILGGNEAAITEAPYQAAVTMFSTKFHCGAAIISEDVVITAALCILRQSYPSMYQVRVGSNSWSEGGQLLQVKSLYVNDKYKQDYNFYFENDIALLPLTTKIIFDGVTVAPIKLVKPGVVTEAGVKGLVTGWGTGIYEYVEKLHKATLTVVDNGQCAKLYIENLNTWPQNPVTKKMVCARVNHLEATCGPDSGSPFVVDGVLVGIVSWEKECGNPLYPAVFTDVSSMIEWIDAGLEWAAGQD